MNTTETEILKDTTENYINYIEQLKVETKPLPDSYITNNIDEYIKEMEIYEEEILSDVIFDYQIIKNAHAFALGLVIAYEGKMMEVTTKIFDSLKKMRKHLQNKKYILFYTDKLITLQEFQNGWKYNHYNAKAKVSYIFRGVILDDTKTN